MLGVGGGVQSAQNMKSIFYLAENFRCCVVCPLAHRSQGQLFEHPSWASAPSRAKDKLQPRGVGPGRWTGRAGGGDLGRGFGEGGRQMSSPQRWVACVK